MSEADYAGLVTAAHHQLHAPLILIWDNLNTHVSAAMRGFTEAHPDWLTEVRLPAYAPDLNAVEGAWANMKNGLGNLAVSDVDQLTAIIKNRLKSIQYRPALIDGFLAQTGLTLEPEPPRVRLHATELAQLRGQHHKDQLRRRSWSPRRCPARHPAPAPACWATRAIKCRRRRTGSRKHAGRSTSTTAQPLARSLP